MQTLHFKYYVKLLCNGEFPTVRHGFQPSKGSPRRFDASEALALHPRRHPWNRRCRGESTVNHWRIYGESMVKHGETMVKYGETMVKYAEM